MCLHNKTNQFNSLFRARNQMPFRRSMQVWPVPMKPTFLRTMYMWISPEPLKRLTMRETNKHYTRLTLVAHRNAHIGWHFQMVK